ncbi:MAG: DNA polymerase III subunit alpha, partial [Lentisphaeria bacterium]|nr:DNA polymerase III subunit alpha [Lentisphaeria bacterium]
MTQDFVHLHVHSDYSMLDGACQVKKLCKKVAELGQTAVAITDHGNMSSAIELAWATNGSKVKPIFGCEFYIVPPQGTKVNKSYSEEDSSKQALRKNFHLIILAKNTAGYENLCRLNALAYSEDKVHSQEQCLNQKEYEHGMNKHFYYKPRISREDLAKHSEGLIGLSACIGGEVPANVLEFVKSADGKSGMGEARKALEFYIETFGREDFYLEIQYHAKPGVEPQDVTDASHRNLLELEKRSNEGLRELSKEYGVELVCTNDAHYLNQEDFEAHDALLCIGTQSMLADTKRFKFSGDQFYVKTSAEMHELFKDYPRAAENTVKIAEKCKAQINHITNDEPVNHYPVYELEDNTDDQTDAHCPIRRRYLLEVCFKGLEKRYKLFDAENDNYERKSEEEPDAAFRKEILDRMHFELGIIDRMGFVSYFLVVWDFINYARSQKIPVGPGRGSGAGSVVAYLTGITDLDPLLYGLLFERFLNPDRVSPPDFDIDFCERRRGEVIEYVRNKYGSPSVAQIGTYGTLKTKAVLKGVARVMGIPFSDANMLVGTIPTDPKMTLEKALKLDEVKAIYDREAWVREVFSKAAALEGLISNQSIHACGVIIGDQPLPKLVPLARGSGKEIITQFPAYPCEEIGLLKMDFLGLKTLTVIQDTLDLVNRYRDDEFTPDDIPLTCAKTYKLLNRGATTGVFQLESGGMQELCKNFRISKIEEIIALVALYRPGPMEFIPTFIA